MADENDRERSGASPWLWLLIIPFIGMLWPAWYSSVQPELAGIPFFYWYQFLWVFIGAGITVLVYALDRARG